MADLNAGASLPVPENRPAFIVLTGAGLAGTWEIAHPGDTGFTSGFDELLDDPTIVGALEHRVHHVMTLGQGGVTRFKIYGIDPDNRTVTGMRPSDHAGVMATLTP